MVDVRVDETGLKSLGSRVSSAKALPADIVYHMQKLVQDCFGAGIVRIMVIRSRSNTAV